MIKVYANHRHPNPGGFHRLFRHCKYDNPPRNGHHVWHHHRLGAAHVVLADHNVRTSLKTIEPRRVKWLLPS
jgi:hypothetical protein